MATSLKLDNFVPYRLSYTSNLVSDVVAHSYDKLFGLKIPEWRMIAIVAESEGVTQQTISQRSRMDKVTVSRAAIALVSRDLVERVPNPADKRSHLLVLTDAGRALYADVAPRALALERSLFDSFDREELDRFVATLRRIDAAALALEAVNPHLPDTQQS
ncbi:MarR family transcriptional regulator [Sphingobium sp. SCG-1]|uniref:MarR family winged helix-turn-helix transcriptional regulator n=1 Tax=Sphingobium sp. SCG-1 TaxID=2072936 RepID=UPI000CD6C42F|nr:MarR family winged helix-turn-helix transcriptional regulator [Sphingobium sp. SCG-1]AUW58325.1 MarR family transcriptional regulator [Sphingobium sp. SCG-1]